MSVITKLLARQILDSRGNPTLEVTAYSGKHFAIASVPSGVSTGTHEALELRDGANKYKGLGVLKAVRIVEKILSPLLKGTSVFDQAAIDAKMIQKDGTLHKTKLGANSILGVSLAVARLGATLSDQPLYQYLAKSYGFKQSFYVPTPLLNVLNGGLHADSGTDVQEFFYIPKRGKFADKLELGSRAISELKYLLKKKRLCTGVGDEGGFAPQLNSNEKALRLLLYALDSAKIAIGKDMALGIDAAASEFFDAKREIYRLRADKKHFKPVSMYRLYTRWVRRYHLEIIEDGCAEDDLVGWQQLTMHLGNQVMLVGDDLFVTDSSRLQAGIIAGVANTILIKPNQVGTLTETMEAIALAKKYNYQVIISHRSGETTDDFIADLAVAVSADFIKAGSLARGERMAKYNRLLKIAEELKQ
jgi:enolase